MSDDALGFFDSLSQPNSVQLAPVTAETPKTRITVTKGGPESFFDNLEQPSSPPNKEYGYGETAALHGMQGLTSGFGDELHGAMNAAPFMQGKPDYALPVPRIIGGLAHMGYEKLMNHIHGNNSHDASDAYTQARDERRKELEESGNQNPITSTVSDVVGSVATPGGSLIKGAGALARGATGAAVGAAQGALRGAGEAKELEDAPESALKSGVIGGVLGGPMGAVFGHRLPQAHQEAVIEAANKYGVQLPYYMVSDSPIMHFAGKRLEELPMVGSAVSRAGDKAREGMKALKDDIVEQATGVQNATSSEVRTMASEAAKDATEGFDKARKAVSTHNYNNVNTLMSNPNGAIIPSALQQEIADQAAKKQAYNGNFGAILQQANDAAQKQGGLTYNALKDLRTELYTKWKSMQGKSDTDYADYVGVLGAITRDMEDVLHVHGGPKAVAAWKSANVQHGVGKDISKELSEVVSKGTSDTATADKIFTSINSAKPNISGINQLRNTMRPAEWEKVQASVLSRMGSDEAGNFSPAKFITADSKMTPAGKDAMFGMANTPRREAYDAIVNLNKTIQNVDRFKNYSKTTPALLGAGTMLGLYNDIKEGHYFNTAGELGAGAVMAAILARPATARSAGTFAKAMDKYLSNPAAWAVGQIPRGLEMAARNFAISLANSTNSDKDKMVEKFVAATPLWKQ